MKIKGFWKQLIRWHKSPIHDLVEANQHKRIVQLFSPVLSDFEKKTTFKELGRTNQFHAYKLEPKDY